jgi:hypothetical protein
MAWSLRAATQQLHINSKSGTGDVVVQIGQWRVVAECKGGPLVKKRSSPEHRILKEVVGQAMLWNPEPNDLLIVAVPNTQWFQPLATTWRQAPLVRRVGIQIVLVSPDGGVSGFTLP